jgi:antitoxin VapB
LPAHRNALPLLGRRRHASALRDDATGDVVLSNRPGAKTWNEFFELLHEVDVPADFMAERPLNVLPQERGIFDDELSTNHKVSR